MNSGAATLAIRIRSELVDIAQVVSRSCLDEYRGLRHVIRNLYSFNLNPLRLQELVAMLPACHSALVQDLEEFCIFLAALD